MFWFVPKFKKVLLLLDFSLCNIKFNHKTLFEQLASKLFQLFPPHIYLKKNHSDFAFLGFREQTPENIKVFSWRLFWKIIST